jgi:lysophospholipase L1-like esterase
LGAPAVVAAAIERFNLVLAEETRAAGAEWMELGALMREQALRGLVSPDGLHPSESAYDAWVGTLLRELGSPC